MAQNFLRCMHLLTSMLFWIVARIQVDILMLLVQELFVLDFFIEGLDEVFRQGSLVVDRVIMLFAFIWDYFNGGSRRF